MRAMMAMRAMIQSMARTLRAAAAAVNIPCHCERSAAISGGRACISSRLLRRLAAPRNDKHLSARLRAEFR
jgi:hypothetical protein